MQMLDWSAQLHTHWRKKGRSRKYIILRILWLHKHKARGEKKHFYFPDQRVCLLAQIAATNRSESTRSWPADRVYKQLSASRKIYEHLFQRLFAIIAHTAIYQAWFPCGSAGARSAAERLVRSGSSSSPPVVSYPDIWPVQIKQRDQRLFPPAAS